MITLTNEAARKIHELHEKLTEPDSLLRVFVEDGGCQGCNSHYHYGMSFDIRKPDDLEATSQDIRILIDPQSAELLQGSVIDFGETSNGDNFIINNPNAKNTCGCGRSFS
ncbi:MAG: iron-sulfur cluster assembly accessory protein [Puniceicoccales bacterium]|jgi:iron-sulfur cluster assembly protein/iron-sulfur cluster insertion protein|nr:iron-sulfur cluster assembly accessory protein [Puniceicoccales bacterium]